MKRIYLLSIILILIFTISVSAQIKPEKFKPFIGQMKIIDTSGPGLKSQSGDILLELKDDENPDFETLMILRNAKGKLTKVIENSALLMGKDVLGVSGGNYPELSGNTLSINYSLGSGSALSDISIVFEKDKNGDYLFKEYTSVTRKYGKEDVSARQKITAAQTGKIFFSEALTEEFILKKAKSANTKPGKNDYQYEPAVSKISGTLTEKMFYGAPNYGETPEKDEKEMVWILKLDYPVNVIAAPDQPDPEMGDHTIRGIKEIQIYTLDKKINLSKYLNKKITVQGPLMSAISGHHHTEVLMEVKQIGR